MPPTIQSGERNDSRRKRGTGPQKSDIVSRVKYGNALPDIPFDPKFITYPFEANRFVQYNATSLERNYKHELLAEHDLGVTIDLINPDTYKIDPMAMLDPADEKLLEEEIATPGDTKRSRQHTKSVSWLRKTEYISSEYNRSVHSRDKAETKVAYSLKKQFQEEDLYKDRDNQINAIEKTFEDAKKPIEDHYSKPHVTPVEVLPVLPDFEMWIHPCAQVIFDDNPQQKDKTTHEAIEEMSQAMIRGMVDESGEQFVGYFLPTEDTTRKRKRDAEEGIQFMEDDEYEYKLCKEYNWNVKNKASRGYEENYFMCFRKGEGVFYDELETRVRLSKRRALNKEGISSNSVLVVKNRQLNDQELQLQEARLSQLDNAPPEEEEEEDEEEEEENKDEGEKEEKEGDSDDEKGEEMETEEQEGSGQEEGSGHEDEGEKEEEGEREEGSGDEREERQGSGSDRAESGSERAESGQESGGEEEQAQGSGQESGHESGHESGRESGHESGRESGHESGRESGQESGQESGAEETQEQSGGEEEQEQEEEEREEEQNEEQAESGSEKEEAGSENEEGGEEEEGEEERERREEEEIFGSDADDSD